VQVVLKNDTYSEKITFLEILVGIRLMLYFIPAAAEYTPSNINLIMVVVIWVLLFSSGSAYVGRKMLQFFPLYLILFANLLWGYESITLPSLIYSSVQSLIYPVAISLFIDTNQKYVIKRLLVLSTVCVVITCITTYFGNIEIPGASRDLAGIWRDDAERAHYLRRMNIGGFEFVYLLTLLMPLLAFVFKQYIGKVWSIVIILLGGLFLITIIKTEYTTALLFSILGLMTIVMPKNYSAKQMVNYVIVGGIVAVLFFPILLSILDYFAYHTESGIIAKRLVGILDILSGNQTSGDTEIRQEVMRISWQSFINNPLTGSDKHGGHSYILDTMAHFGIFGVLFVIIVFRTMYKLFVRPYKESAIYGALIVVFIIQIILCIVNTMIFESAFIIFVLMTAYLIEHRSAKWK